MPVALPPNLKYWLGLRRSVFQMTLQRCFLPLLILWVHFYGGMTGLWNSAFWDRTGVIISLPGLFDASLRDCNSSHVRGVLDPTGKLHIWDGESTLVHCETHNAFSWSSPMQFTLTCGHMDANGLWMYPVLTVHHFAPGQTGWAQMINCKILDQVFPGILPARATSTIEAR